MTSGQEHLWHIELDYMLSQVRHAKEILGRGEPDCAYRANKVLEVVAFRLKDLCDETKGEIK
jgi:hypothetical protein